MRVNPITPAALLMLVPLTLMAGVAVPAATPEPGTIPMLGGGLATLAFFGWRRSRKR